MSVVFLNAQRPFGGIGGLWGPARTDHQRRVAPRRPRHAPVVAIANMHHEQHVTTQQPRRPESEHPQKPPPCACGQAGSQGGRVWCMAVFSTHEHAARAATLDKYAAGAISVRVGGGGCLWMWLCGRWRRCAEARRRRDAAVRQESRISRMTKISELGCQQTPFKQPGAILGS